MLVAWASGFAQSTLTGSWDLTTKSSEWTATGNEVYFKQPYGYKSLNGTLVNKSIADFSTSGITQIKVGFKCLQNGGTNSRITIYLVDANGQTLGTGIVVTPVNASAAASTAYKYATFTSNLEEATGFMMKVTTFGKNILVNGAKYEVTYTSGPSKTPTALDFGFSNRTVNINKTFTAPATLKADETAISGAVTYTSSNPKVATVNETTGEVSALVAGTTKITATYAGTSEYQGATAYYILTVVDPNATEVTFDFTDPTSLNYSNSETTDLKEGDKFVKEPITLTNKKNGSTSPVNRLYKSTSGFFLGFYQNGEMVLSAADGYAITGVSYTIVDKNTLKIDGVLANEDWTGNAKSLILSIDKGASATKIKTMTVSFTKTAANPTLSLDENAEKSVTDEALLNAVIAGKAYDVTLTRTLTANAWNTICLPFDVTAEQIADVLKSAGNVKEFDSEDANTQTIYFKDATTMTAGKPYLIKPTESATELVFKGVKITEYEPKNDVSGDNYAVYGTFGKYTMKTDGTELFLKTDGKFYIPAAGTATMKGFRAYFFNVNGSTAGAALNLSFGEATGIDGVAADAEKNVKVYNVNGQYVGTSLDALPKGLYIVGGKKVLK